MKTPEQIRDMEFQKSPMGGYKQSDVELFLEEIASQIELLMKQKSDCERKLQEFSQKAPEAALSTAGIQNVLVSAQRVADEIVDDAKKNADEIVAQSNLKLNEANVKARDIISAAENKAVLLGETAESEATKIIAAAVQKSEVIVATAKESVDLEQKLYDRMKIEIADFRKKASAQTAALSELINQLPDEIPFNLERSKTVLSVDFSNPEELLKNAVESKIAAAKTETDVEVKKAANPVEQVTENKEPEIQEVSSSVIQQGNDEPEEIEIAENLQLNFDNPMGEDFEMQKTDEHVHLETHTKKEETVKSKNHISFGEDDEDDEDDDDGEPRLFGRKRKK